MEISGVSPEAMVMATSAQGREARRAAAMMKKTQDIAESQAPSLIELVRNATPEGVGTHVNLYV